MPGEKRIVFVISDEGLGGVAPFGKEIDRLGMTPVLITGKQPDRQLQSWQQIYSRVIVLEDPYNSNALVETALNEAGETPIAGLFSCYDGLIIPAAKAAKELGLPHPAIEGLSNSRNKYAGRIMTQRKGLRTPKFLLVSNETDGEQVGKAIGWPAIIKPVNGMASHLVRKINNAQEFSAAFKYIRKNILNSFPGNYRTQLSLPAGLDRQQVDPMNFFLVEEFIEGIEYSLELCVRKGKAEVLGILQKFIVDPVNFFECGFTLPGFYWTKDWHQMICDFVQDVANAVGLDNTVANIELIDSPQGPYIVEINAGRPGGQLMVMAIRKSRGRDLIHDTVALATGMELNYSFEPEINGRVTTFTVFPQKSGVLSEIRGLDKVKEMNGIRAVVPFCSPGDKIDLEDKEIFVVNFLSDADGTESELGELYLSVRNEIDFVFENEHKTGGMNTELPEEKFIASPDKLNSFYVRSKLLKWLRGFMEQKGFLEVTTPVLHARAEACCVQQFSLETPAGNTLYLRTDPEEYLKRYLTAGLPAVFEISTNFRCDAPSARSLQEFTSMECYRKGAGFEDSIQLLNEIFAGAIQQFGTDVNGVLDNKPYNIQLPFPVEKFTDLVEKHAGISLKKYPFAEVLSREIIQRKWWSGTGTAVDAYRRTWIEWIFDNKVLPALNYPVIVVDFPADMGLSAEQKPADPDQSFRGELYFPGGFEVAHFYQNLTNHQKLRARYEERRRHRIASGLPPVDLDEGLMASAALGMPPMSGLALGIERFMMILFKDWAIEDGLLFPREGV